MNEYIVYNQLESILNVSNEVKKIDVVDVLGKIVFSTNSKISSFAMLPNGIYNVILGLENNKRQSIKILKN